VGPFPGGKRILEHFAPPETASGDTKFVLRFLQKAFPAFYVDNSTGWLTGISSSAVDVDTKLAVKTWSWRAGRVAQMTEESRKAGLTNARVATMMTFTHWPTTTTLPPTTFHAYTLLYIFLMSDDSSWQGGRRKKKRPGKCYMVNYG